MKKSLHPFLVLYFLTLPLYLHAQMEVSDASAPPFTPENLISNIFLGDGVSIIDISYQGDPRAVGFFKDGQNAIGLDRGIILSSGRAAAQSCNGGPFGADCNGNAFANNPMTGNVNDPDLNAIANGTPEDVAKYTIVFQPFADTLRFRYVFASEEYPEYSCSPFNDVFGFFISGPGITGPYSNNGRNIALIPGTNTPVSIDNIHPPDPATPGCTGLNDQFYNNNNGFPLQPVYDGYLDVFTAEIVVIPCETYTIKIMISDVGDPNWDSGVFLEAKSFGTGTIEVETSTISLDGTITEGCSDGSFTLSLPFEAESDVLLDYTIIGTAINGVDYALIPNDLFIPEGATSITIPVLALVDGLTEGLESIGIDIQRDVCNRDTFWMFIRDNGIVPPDLGPDLLFCQGESAQLDGTLPLPLPVPPSFTNENNFLVDDTAPVYSPILVAGVQPLTLGPGVIRSVCVNIDHIWVDDLDLYLISPGGQFIELSTMNGANCDNYNNVCFSPNATTPINYVFPWPICTAGQEPGFSNGTFQPEGIWDDLWGGPTNGTWRLLLLDESTGFNGVLNDWNITFEPLYQLQYNWLPATGLSCADCPDPIASPGQSTTYILSVSDTYGCTVQDTIRIEVTATLAAPIVNCVAVSNNSITFEWGNVAGAMGYLVSVNGSQTTVPNNGPLSHIVAGLGLDETVNIAVQAIGACPGETGNATCTTPACDAPAILVEELRHINCQGDDNGFVSLSASGGAGDYVFILNGTTTNTTGNFPGLDGGQHSFSVMDSWGCPNTIELTIIEPESLEGTPMLLNNVSCFGSANGSATVEITGGAAPYLINWSNGQMGDTVTNLGPGSHFGIITDANGCTENFNFPVTQPGELLLTLSTQDANCAGSNTGSATVQVEGGTTPYSIRWDAGAGNAITPTVSALAPGSYTVAVTDANGCIKLEEAVIGAPTGFTVSLSKTDVGCFGNANGTVNTNINGGNQPYSYLWNNGQTTPDLTGLTVGMYQVVVTDNAGCTGSASISITAPPSLEVSLSANGARCFGDASGDIQSVVEGGTLPYSFTWSNGQTSPGLSNVAAANYCLTVNDANGCSTVSCVEVTQPSVLQATSTTTNAACNNPEGAIALQTTGGTLPYQFLWSNAATTQSVNNLLPGDYEVTITDANGCTTALSATVNESQAITATISTTPVLCFGENTGGISLSLFGGTGSYSFSWTGPNGFSSNLEDLTGISQGQYDLFVTDSDGCTFSTDVEVPQPTTPLELTATVTDVACPGERNGFIRLEATGGTPPYLFQLDNGGFFGIAQFVSLESGIYQAEVMDMNGCLVELPDLLLGAPEPFDVDLGDDLVVQYGEVLEIVPALVNIPDSQISDFVYFWTSNNQDVPPLPADQRITLFEATASTTATLTLTSLTGCKASDTLNIFVLKDRTVTVPTGFTPGIDGPSENNLLHVHGNSTLVKNIRLFQLFDRWGELLYEASDFPINDFSIGWDGTFKGQNMPPGVYAWYLEVEFIDGLTEKYRGHSTLVR